MMKRIGNKATTKLKSNSGVTILFALLAFAVASVVSGIIVANASSSVKRTHSIQQSTQDNATLDSAALLLKDELDGKVYNFDSYNLWSDIFENDINEISRSFYYDWYNAPSGTFIISVNDYQDDLQDVTVDYVASKDYQIVAYKLSIDDNVMYVTFSINLSSSGTTQTVEWSFEKASGKDEYNVFTS